MQDFKTKKCRWAKHFQQKPILKLCSDTRLFLINIVDEQIRQEAKASVRAARFLLAPILTNWAVKTERALHLAHDLQRYFGARLFSPRAASETGKKTH